ncbi:Hypothetical protein PENO1_047940 [Penicillium occitanis (nom. inval.)]|nr:hypothetical protein PENOC_054620 [Penicillium occitanis (nom. inval.)]PCH00440.1 Hypothetical protein PENO1_047940 [Penicillium occitanis (nom. inval.)]
METQNSSSPQSVLSAEEVKQWNRARDELFIQIYRRRGVYFQRWREVTLKYFAAIDKGMENAKKVHENNIADVIERYANKIKKRRDKFIKSYSYELVNDDGTLSYLDGLDKLVKPVDRSHRKDLIRKEREYREKNERLNPDTKVLQGISVPNDGNPPGNATQEAEESSYEDELPAAADWKSEAGDSDTDSIFAMEK